MSLFSWGNRLFSWGIEIFIIVASKPKIKD
jgi:hypothetical protein